MTCQQVPTYHAGLGCSRINLFDAIILSHVSWVRSSPISPSAVTTIETNTSDWNTNFAYGAGLQGKIGALAIRAEYERISASGGNPDIISLGVTWTF